MTISKFNWQIWVGFVLGLFAFISYPTIFVEWPFTRDFPWVNLILFAIAEVFLAFGIIRSFKSSSLPKKIVAAILMTLSSLVLAGFIFVAFVMSTWLPESAAAPQVGQTAPDFTLSDTNNKQLPLSELRTTPIKPGSPAPKGVLLIFYRGYW